MAIKLGIKACREQPLSESSVCVGGRTQDACAPWYPYVTAAAYDLSVTAAAWKAGEAFPLKAVTMRGEAVDIASNDPHLEVYGLDLDYTAGSQAVTLVYAGHLVDVVLTVTGSGEEA